MENSREVSAQYTPRAFGRKNQISRTQFRAKSGASAASSGGEKELGSEAASVVGKCQRSSEAKSVERKSGDEGTGAVETGCESGEVCWAQQPREQAQQEAGAMLVNGAFAGTI